MLPVWTGHCAKISDPADNDIFTLRHHIRLCPFNFNPADVSSWPSSVLWSVGVGGVACFVPNHVVSVDSVGLCKRKFLFCDDTRCRIRRYLFNNRFHICRVDQRSSKRSHGSVRKAKSCVILSSPHPPYFRTFFPCNFAFTILHSKLHSCSISSFLIFFKSFRNWMTSLIEQLPAVGLSTDASETAEREIEFFPYKNESEMRCKGIR